MRHIRKGTNPIKVPLPLRTNNPALRDFIGETREAIRNLATRLPQASNRPIMGSGGNSGRFKFGGIYKDADNKWRVKIGEGSIFYHEIFLWGDFASQKSKPQYIRGVFPTIEIDGDDIRIDDPSKPAIELGDRENASVWVVAKKDQCNQTGEGTGRIVISDRGEDPEIESSEDAYQIVDFDVEETDGGGKRATQVYKHLQSDLVQSYACDKGDSESDDYDGSDMDGSSDFVPASSSGIIDSTPSGSSDEDSDGEDEPCRVYVTAGWENSVVCFPAKPGLKCVPASYTFVIRVKFHFGQPFGGKICEGIAYGAKLEGGVIPNEVKPNEGGEYRWRDEEERELTWRVDNPPACGVLRLTWRVKTFPVKRGPLDPPSDDQGCCNQSFPNKWNTDKNGTGGTVDVILRQYTTTGPWDRRKTTMPKVCGDECNCSSTSVTPPPTPP